MGITTRIRTLATASLVALAIISIPVSQAYAEPNTGGGSGGTKTCTDPDGKQQPAGTVWTSTTLNGQVASRYKCNGKTGEWDRVPDRLAPSTGPRVVTTGGVLSR
jgi:hypothetical protein